jgi:predicted dienelactone hydrolase
MRTFEIALIVVNIMSLFLCFKKQSKVVWLSVAGANLILLIIHGIFEGFRYQMAFSYLFVILFIIYSLIKTNNKFFEMKTPKVMKVIMISLSCVFLIFTSILAYALPVFTLPIPTGNFAVGVKYFHLVDEERNDPFLDKSKQKRELMVKIYYPAKGDESKSYTPYFRSPELLKMFAGFYNLPNFMFDHLNLVKTNLKENLRLSNNENRYPVVLFSHGAGTSIEAQTSQCEDLASHGYIVVAIDHTYVSAATIFPNRVVSHKEATTDFHTPEPAEIITRIMTDDASFVIDELEEINVGKINSIFKGRLNLDKLGAIGHSVGGAVAYNLANNDSRVKAAIDLDGVVYITPKENMAPFLLMASDTNLQSIQKRKPLMKKFEEMTDEDQKFTIAMNGSEKRYKETYNRAQQNIIGLSNVLKMSGNLFSVEGSEHMNFTDIGLFIGISQLRELMGLGGKTDSAKTLEITSSVTAAFFNQHLKDKSKDSLESLIKKYPELKQVKLK